ncbi:MAG TPA: DUF1707 and DUF4190 domain-containing protein [Trebonia sp.]|nr:DUF1707 and DUF4190 domain-containing protein [Trebonia sp.]
MSWQAPESSTHGYYAMTNGDRSRIRAADVDRDHVAGILGMAFGEGRLSRDEYDTRLEEALHARTYGELDLLLSDLPVARVAPASPVARPQDPLAGVNRLAIASIICGIAQFMIVPLAIPAIILGHKARSQIRRTGERGGGLALAGLLLGWLVAVVIILSIAVGLAATIGTHGGPVPSH